MHLIRSRLAVAALLGTLAGIFLPLGRAHSLTHPLAGFVVGGLAFAVPLLLHIRRQDAASTQEHVRGRDGDAAWYDFVIIIVGLSSLAGVSILLIGSQSKGTTQVVESLVGVLVVAVGWVCVHTVYVLRYARLYYATRTDGRAPIDFNMEEDPAFSDFTYFSFNLGMAYQVSDTAVRSPDVRRVILGHCLLAYLYGTIVIASTINLVAGIGGKGGG
ncbi:DUF1345 domain-containing protein [Terrabacter sp. BE26]|uniref:DUF1345 domain-containing protein n=1 Tax=Terrabacter sp. BE26 TaxID=2898152 RepID=UPI0035BE8DF5